jgi:hypothetical protein
MRRPVPGSYGPLMTTPTLPTSDLATIERVAEAFHRCFETFEDSDGVIADDAFFDLYPPFWRFQIQGRQAFLDQLRAIATGPVRLRVLRLVPTVSGFVSETEETVLGERGEVARHLWLCEVRDGRITEAVTYCNGGWDEELVARNAAEAPILRP